MIRIRDIQKALFHLVGWEQSHDPKHWISPDLTESESGLTFQAAHPLLTIESVLSVIPDTWGVQYSEWNALLQYRKGDIANHGGMAWQAKEDNIGEEPTASDFNGDFSREDYGNPYWKPYNLLNSYLEKLTNDGIAAMAQRFLNEKSLSRQSRPLLERRALFDGAGRISDLAENHGEMAGFEIKPVRGMGVTAKIERLGLQMRGATGKVTVYLFHSGSPDPVCSQEVEITDSRGMFKWAEVKDWHLPYDGAGGSGGAWYLCYDQSALPAGMHAVNSGRDFSKPPCGTCNRGNAQAWREFSRYLQAVPFRAQSDGAQMWDIGDNIYTPTVSYGLNFEVSVGCDLTGFITSQRGIFATALQKQVAYGVLRTLAMNPYVRVNRTQANADRADILYELDGNPQGRKSGLGVELERAYKALDLDTERLDPICLTCGGKGVKYTTV